MSLEGIYIVELIPDSRCIERSTCVDSIRFQTVYQSGRSRRENTYFE
jgi:hypothetical protein